MVESVEEANPKSYSEDKEWEISRELGLIKGYECPGLCTCSI